LNIPNVFSNNFVCLKSTGLIINLLEGNVEIQFIFRNLILVSLFFRKKPVKMFSTQFPFPFSNFFLKRDFSLNRGKGYCFVIILTRRNFPINECEEITGMRPENELAGQNGPLRDDQLGFIFTLFCFKEERRKGDWMCNKGHVLRSAGKN